MRSLDETQLDPVFRSSLREARWILLYWAVFFVWVVGYSTLFGYPPEDQPLVTVLGMPSWVFWGVFLPWIVSGVVSIWFALTQIQDHPLGEINDTEQTDG